MQAEGTLAIGSQLSVEDRETSQSGCRRPTPSEHHYEKYTEYNCHVEIAMTVQEPSIPSWPSSRLWRKFLISLCLMPAIVALLLQSLLAFTFSAGAPLYLIQLLLIAMGGPIGIAWLLRPSWRTAAGGLTSVVALPLLWYVATMAYEAIGFAKFPMVAALTAAGAAVLLELISGDVRSRLEFIGLATGFAVGLIVMVVYGILIGLVGRSIAMSTDQYLFANVSMPTALMWTSMFFFPEWMDRKVGRGGLLIWGAATVTAFGGLLALSI